MSSARVESIDAILAFRTVLWKFAEAGSLALADAEGEIQRTITWLETEQVTHWQSQIRKRGEILVRAKEALRQKTLFKDATGARQSAVEEQKAVAVAQRRLEEAEQKLAAVKRWRPRLQREYDLYKGSVQRFMGAVESDVPNAARHLDTVVKSVQEYLSLQAEGAGAGGSGEAAGAAPPSTDEDQQDDNPGSRDGSV